jgi:hypothetical protein
MKRTVVRYRTKPEMADENQRLIESVFAELQTKSPEGIRYLVMKLGDGTFIHFVIVESDDGDSPLPRLEAFQSFRSRIAERCIEQPQTGAVTIVGNYRMLGRS